MSRTENSLVEIASIHFRIIKNTVRYNGANVTKPHLGLVPKVAFELLEAGRACELTLDISKASSHSVRSADADLKAMLAILLENKIAAEGGSGDLAGKKFADPRREGIIKVEKGWLREFLIRKKPGELENGDEGHVQDLDDVVLI